MEKRGWRGERCHCMFFCSGRGWKHWLTRSGGIRHWKKTSAFLCIFCILLLFGRLFFLVPFQFASWVCSPPLVLLLPEEEHLVLLLLCTFFHTALFPLTLHTLFWSSASPRCRGATLQRTGWLCLPVSPPSAHPHLLLPEEKCRKGRSTRKRIGSEINQPWNYSVSRLQSLMMALCFSSPRSCGTE